MLVTVKRSKQLVLVTSLTSTSTFKSWLSLGHITACGYLQWATLTNVLGGLASRRSIVEEVIATFQVKVAKGSPDVELDYDFLREYLQVTGTPRPRPVWQLCLETRARVKRYASGSYGEKVLGLGRSTIDQAVRKKVKAGGTFWEWADFAREQNISDKFIDNE